MIDFTTFIEPVAKARPRVTVRGGKPRAYTPKKTAQFEAALASNCPGPPIEGPVGMVIDIGLPIPVSWSKQKTLDALNDRIKPTSRPDIDNYAKAVLDALDSVAYQDDSQVIALTVRLWYAASPHVRVIASEA